MANKVEPVPNLPNVSKASAEVLQNLVKAATLILIKHATRLNAAFTSDGVERMSGPLALAQYATGGLPDATLNEGKIVYDLTAQVVKYSDGATWTAL